MDQPRFEELQGPAATPGHDDLGGRAAMVPAFAIGFLFGAALALLWAPAPGRETRHWIYERGQLARRRTSEFVERRWQALQIIRSRGVIGLVRRGRTGGVAG